METHWSPPEDRRRTATPSAVSEDSRVEKEGEHTGRFRCAWHISLSVSIKYSEAAVLSEAGNQRLLKVICYFGEKKITSFSSISSQDTKQTRKLTDQVGQR